LGGQAIGQANTASAADGDLSEWELVDAGAGRAEDPGRMQTLMQMAELIYFTQACPTIGEALQCRLCYE